ncbi:Raf kinase inhibitor-like YbhB/YbcL family protein [Saccharothrix coeruleofusca]|nr:YbhB/YbcL family Raf kinase inhibitor-like protein [Saccharothrix coeruleofusca]MBP2336655.1 Raf kinase inhibitor-like YbhB/YbcL family protein [Saccharothrix coeruleofusca]
MPNPGSHGYDVRRTRLRAEYDDTGTPDQHADQAANEELQREHPPVPLGDRAAGPPGTGGEADQGGLSLRSSAFSGHTLIPDRYSRDGGNTSPPLEWASVPDGARELVLLCEDPDTGGEPFVHWVVTGIPANASGIPEGSLLDGAVVGRNGYGEPGWGGPRPPVGEEHRYFFRLYAVDRPLEVGEGATAEEVRAALEGRVLAHGTLVGVFGR